MAEPGQSRHLRSEYVDEYLKAGNRAVVVIAGKPSAQLIIDPPTQRIGIELEWDGAALPDLLDYRHLNTAIAFHDGRNWAQLWILDPRVLLDGYPMLCALADKVQGGISMSAAIPEVLTSYSRILEGNDRLTTQEEIGLMGELLLLEHLLHTMTQPVAVASWRGGDNEEHDFSIASADVEVKTTTAETRRHWIGSHTQLTPSPGRPLVLVSIQLTAGVDQSNTLSEQVARIRNSVDDSNRGEIDARLGRVGWREAHAPQYRRRFRLRSLPLAYSVDDAFPAITAGRLANAGLPIERLSRVSYELDVSGLPLVSPIPAFLVGFVGSSL